MRRTRRRCRPSKSESVCCDRRARYAQLAALEPRLADLLRAADESCRRSRKPSATDRVFYQAFKPWVTKLAGASAAVEAISTCQAYDLVYETVYEALHGRCWK